MRTLLLAALLACALPARAGSSFSTDVTDLWWNPDESGWGVNVIQQNNIVFATFFVYDTSGRAHWYVASAMTAQSASASSATFQGDLFESQGPYFAVPFNALAVARNQVGTATLQVAFPGDGFLTYTIGDVTVTKAIRRQTWALNDPSGAYEGQRVISSSTGSCVAGATPFSAMQVVVSQGALSLRGTLGGAACRFDGDYSQQGRLGASSGTFSCSDGNAGSYTLTEIEAGLYGFFARYSGTERGCSVQGRIGGVNTVIRQVAE
jgi:hypothetical protein